MLAIGTVAGASIDFTVYKNLAQVLPYVGLPCVYYGQYGNNYNYYPEGKFTITDVKENGLNKSTVTAYDNCRKLDKVIYPLLARVSYPMTLQRLFIYICAYCGIPYDTNTYFHNANVEITSSFGDYKTTCREVVEWMAQLAGSIVVADVDGYLVFKDLSAPTNSRGSNETKNYTLDVSLRPLAKPAAILYSGPSYNIFVLGNRVSEAETENRILDFTNNLFLKDYIVEIDGVNLCRSILARIDKIGDVYAYEVKLDNNSYGMECGDSWVVASTNLTPRRGIIMNKTIDDSGVVFTSTGELESLIIDDAVDENAIDELIYGVDGYYSSIKITSIVVKDASGATTDTYTVNHTFTKSNPIYNGNDLYIDITTQYDDFVNGGNNLTVIVNNDECLVNITGTTMTIFVGGEVNYDVSQFRVYKNNNLFHSWNLSEAASNNFVQGSELNIYEPT